MTNQLENLVEMRTHPHFEDRSADRRSEDHATCSAPPLLTVCPKGVRGRIYERTNAP